MPKSRVFIYGLCNVFYDSYYIQGLKEIFSEIQFSTSKFPNFSQGTFAFILYTGNDEKKVIIDSRDSNEIDIEALNWCDKYGKVNYNESSLDSITNKNKIVPIGPSFGIKIWSFFKSVFLGLKHLIIFNSKIKYKREFIANYWRQYRRCPLKKYDARPSKESEVFFISSIWQKENITNNYRASFITECQKNPKVKFEGGFAPRKNGNNFGYDKLVYKKRISLSSYISRIKNSMFVFNTPAVLSCHGWKLAEFLALGKVIISTPHINVLPEPMIDNIDVIYVQNSTDISNKIQEILIDLEMKRRLEKNSRIYFERNLTPKNVINKLVE